MTPGYPDLQELVAEHGSYGAITEEAWKRHDRAIREWNRRYRAGLPVPPEKNK